MDSVLGTYSLTKFSPIPAEKEDWTRCSSTWPLKASMIQKVWLSREFLRYIRVFIGSMVCLTTYLLCET